MDPLAIVALVCGIAAVTVGCCCTFFGIPLQIAAVVCGVVSLGRVKQEPHRYAESSSILAIIGIVLGGLGVVVLVLSLVLGLGGQILNQIH